MSRPSPERALRKLVADLGRAHPEDVAAVLTRLDPDHQGRARALFAAYVGREFTAPKSAERPESAERSDDAAPKADPAAWPQGLSPWLLARLGATLPSSGAAGEPAAAGPAITTTAQAALRASARGLPPVMTPPDGRKAPSKLDRRPRWRTLIRPKAWRR